MDLATILAGGVALLIAISGYLLFNDVPGLGSPNRARKTSRR